MSSTSANASGDATSESQPRQSVLAFMFSNRIEAALWITRMMTLCFCLGFLLPVFGGHPNLWYQRALLSNAATSALRLHQRVSRDFAFNRESLGRLFTEDTCHYLMYSILFLTAQPVTIALVPIFMFALLHSTTYGKSLLQIVGTRGNSLIDRLLNKISTNQSFLLRFIAINEIMMMPILITMMFGGGGNLLLLFFYYRFLTLRYASLRNPYCRTVFRELHISLSQLSYHPSCPRFITNIINQCIAVISRLAPANAPNNIVPPQ